MSEDITPMLVQYLVGLCCMRNHPTAVEIVLGDMVLDTAAGKVRDVDVTVTVQNDDASLSAFKAYEVKRESGPLDVAAIEQLCLKLSDMPRVTYRAIVSTSGFTNGARAKANAHGVELFQLKSSSQSMDEVMKVIPVQVQKFEGNLLYWVNHRLNLIVPDGPGKFTWNRTDPVYSPTGSKHERYENLGTFEDAVLKRSTEILWSIDPADMIYRTFPFEKEPNGRHLATPPWPHTHTLDVASDEVYIEIPEKHAAVRSVTISGFLQWRKQIRVPEIKVMERVGDGEIFASAAVASYGSEDERMFAMVFGPNSSIANVHNIVLEEKHRNMIRALKLKMDE